MKGPAGCSKFLVVVLAFACLTSSALAAELKQALGTKISDVSIAGPGFLNIKLTDNGLVKDMQLEPAQSQAGKVIVTEYSDPNPFKMYKATNRMVSIEPAGNYALKIAWNDGHSSGRELVEERVTPDDALRRRFPRNARLTSRCRRRNYANFQDK